MTRCVLIGGEFDGRYIEFPGGYRPVVYMPKVKRSSAIMSAEKPDISVSEKVEYKAAAHGLDNETVIYTQSGTLRDLYNPMKLLDNIRV